MNILYLTPSRSEKSGIVDYSIVFEQILKQEGFQITKAKYMFNNQSTWWLPLDFLLRNKFWMNLLHNIDVVHAEVGAHQAKEILTLFYLLKKRKNLRLFITVHDPGVNNYRIFKIYHNMSGSFLSKVVTKITNQIEPIIDDYFFRNVFAHILKYSSVIFVFNNWGIKQLLVKYPSARGKINIINHPIFNFPKQNIKQIVGRKIVFAGFWSNYKGIETLVHAYYLLKTKHRNGIPRLVLSGETQVLNSFYSRQVKKLVENLGLKDFVDLPGFLERKEMLKVLSKAFLIMPYTNNISGSASGIYIAGLQAGAVTIVADNPTLSSFTNGNYASLIFKQGVVEDLYKKLWRVLMDHDLAHRLAKNGQDFIYKYGDWKRLGKSIIKIYESY